MFAFEYYWMPVLELIVSIVLPIVLTLKSLQLMEAPQTVINDKVKIQLVRFWCVYWMFLFVLQCFGVDKHIRVLLTLGYFTQNKIVNAQLINLYESYLLPNISKVVNKIAKTNMNENAIDHYLLHIIDKLCFDASILDIISLFKLNVFSKNTHSTSSFPFNLNPTHEHLAGLEIPKTRERSNRKSSHNKDPINIDLNKRVHSSSSILGSLDMNNNIGSNQNSRKASWNTLGNKSRNVSGDMLNN